MALPQIQHIKNKTGRRVVTCIMYPFVFSVLTCLFVFKVFVSMLEIIQIPALEWLRDIKEISVNAKELW